jgi:hypothetical protein
MGSEFTFYDYIDADGSGVNIINTWMNGDGKAAKAYFNTMIHNLEASPPAGTQYSLWQHHYVGHLHDEWKGFREIRKEAKGVQYRLICKIEKRNVFLVTWGYHRGRWITDSTPQTCMDRVVQMQSNPRKYGEEHDDS